MPVPSQTWPLVCVNADFTQGPPNVPGAAQLSLDAPTRRHTARKWSTARGRQYELNQVQAGTATITVTDPLEYLHPLNVATGSNFLLNPSFENGVTGWTGSNAATIAQQVGASSGYYSALVTSTTVASTTGINPVNPIGGLTAGTTYVFAADVNPVTAAITPTLSVDWYNAGNTYLSSTTTTLASVTPGAWTTVSANMLAPATATQCYPFIFGGTIPVGGAFGVDNVALYVQGTVKPTVGSPFNTGGNTVKPYRPLQIGAFWNAASGNMAGNVLNAANQAPGQPNIGSAYAYDPSFETWNVVPGGYWIIAADGTSFTGNVVTLPSGPLNSNVGFETAIAPWTVTGGTVAQSTTQKHSGTFAARITPSGAAAQVFLESEKVAVTPGNLYCVNLWVWATNAVTSNFSASINWYNASNTYLSTSSLTVSLTAATWTNVQNTFTAPAGAATGTVVPTLSGTPAAAQIFYVDDASLTNGTNPADGSSSYAVTKGSMAASNSYIAWIPRVIGGGTYTLSVDVYAPTGVTARANYGSYVVSSTVAGAWQTLSMTVTAGNGFSWQLFASAAPVYPATIYFANWRIVGLSPGWSQTAGSAMVYTQAQAHSGQYSLGTVMQASTDSMSLPLPTAPGITYTMSSWVWAVGVGSVVSMAVGGSSATSSAVGAWQRVTVTFAAVDAVTTVSWSASAGTYPVTFYLDDIQLEAAASASTYSAAGPTWYPIFTGYVERYPLQYSMSGTRGVRPLAAVDALAVLSRTQINQSYQSTILADGPNVYIPYSDKSLPQQVQMPTGGQASVGYYVPTTYTPPSGTVGGASYVNFQGSPFLDGSPALSITQQGSQPVSTDSRLVSYLGTSGGQVTASTNALTIECWVQYSAGGGIIGAASLKPGVDLYTDLQDVGGHYVGWAVGPTVALHYRDPANNHGISNTGIPGPWPGYADGQWHYLAILFTGSSNYAAVVDTSSSSPQPFFGAVSTAIALNNFFVLAGATQGSVISTFSVANMATYPYALSSTQLTSHYNRGLGYINEVSGARVTRLLNQYWRGGQTVAAGYLKMAPDFGYQGRMLLDVLQEIQESERGLVYADRRGNVVFEDRVSRYGNQTALWTLGESPSGGEYPYQDYAGDYDPTYTFSQANLSRPGNSNYPPRVNQQTQNDFGQRILTQTLQANTDFDMQEAGRYYLARYGTPKVRVQKLTLNPASNPALWPVVLSLEISQRVTVKRRSGGLTTSNDYYIESIRHNVDGDAGTWTVDLEMSPVFVAQAWVLGDATYGVLGTTTIPVY